ncbi:MAG TPA: TIGR03086 family metal-binding protein [Nocardioidaceae bacterium]|nr:TIGR03086 family metal-binding protein [Nocardioidaceae bacterium]
MDLNTLYHRTVECWATRVNEVGDHQWDDPTPCTEWTVRDLVNHVVGEDRWTVPLMEGQTIEQVGARLDGDLLGSAPIQTALAAAKDAVSVVAERLPGGEPVHLSYGEESPEEYVRQLAADHLVHAWDLAAATGGDTRLEPHLVTEVAAWFVEREEVMRAVGLIGPRAALTGDPQSDLLAAFGRRAHWGRNDATLARFSRAFGAGDVEAIMALMTDDCVFEATSPAPDGERREGVAAVRAVWEELFSTTADASFTEEESFVCEDRGVLRWRFSWTGPDGSPGHVRGVDVLRFRDGKVSEKLSYVKG